jgi:hypothetical protein
MMRCQERFTCVGGSEAFDRPTVVIHSRGSRLPQGQDDPRNHQRDESTPDHNIWPLSIQTTPALNIDVHVRSKMEGAPFISRSELIMKNNDAHHWKQSPRILNKAGEVRILGRLGVIELGSPRPRS